MSRINQYCEFLLVLKKILTIGLGIRKAIANTKQNICKFDFIENNHVKIIYFWLNTSKKN